MNALSLSNQQLGSRHDVARLPGEFARDSLLAGLIGGIGMTAVGLVLALSAGYDIWLPLKPLGSLFLGSGALSQAGFVAGPVFAGLLIHLIVAALLGGVFIIVTRQIWLCDDQTQAYVFGVLPSGPAGSLTTRVGGTDLEVTNQTACPYH